MNHLKTRRRFRRTLIAACLLVGFGAISAFSPFLHSHEFNLAHVEKNCAPCHWAQSHANLETLIPNAAVARFFQPLLLIREKVFFEKIAFSFSGRGPPAIF
ncbi:MAG: hypothetical protein ACE5G9_07065 [Nitrospinales bacterium]